MYNYCPTFLLAICYQKWRGNILEPEYGGVQQHGV